jgi:hypothetical protein
MLHRYRHELEQAVRHFTAAEAAAITAWLATNRPAVIRPTPLPVNGSDVGAVLVPGRRHRSQLTDEAVRAAHKRYLSTNRRLSDIARELGWSTTPLRKRFAELRLEVRRGAPRRVAA